MPVKLQDLGRLSDPALLILTSLASGHKHGYAMMLDIQDFSGTHLEPGTLYGALSRLERYGLIAALPGELRRRPYRLTEVGTALLQAQLTTLQQVTVTGLARLAPA